MGAAATTFDDRVKDCDTQDLVLKFQEAVRRAAGITDTDSCGVDGGPCQKKQKLQDLYKKFDENDDGVLDQHEMAKLIERLSSELDGNVKTELKDNMQSLLLSLAGDDSFSILFDQFIHFMKNEPSVCNSPIISKEPKRVVFVGPTGAGKSSLCTVLTGQKKNNSTFAVSSKSSSQTTECNGLKFRWFGDDDEEEFFCVDTPGLDDELGRDEKHINDIIETMQKLEYVNSIVLVVNGQSTRFSTSLQKMIKEFEKAFTNKFYEHSFVVLTKWFMNADAVEEREEDGQTEETVAKDLNEKLCGSKNLLCGKTLPVVFVDSFYERRDPKNGKARLLKVKENVGNTVFRTADLSKVKPKIVGITNSSQVVRSGTPMSTMVAKLFDSTVDVKRWECRPDLPAGLIFCPENGHIFGTPEAASEPTDYELFAESVGGWSEGFPIRFEVAHSEGDIKAIVMMNMKHIEDELEVMLPLEGEDIPKDENAIKRMISASDETSEKLIVVAIEELEKNYGKFSSLPELKKVFRAEVERKLTLRQNEFLRHHQTTLGESRQRLQAEKDLEIQLIRDTTNVEQLKRYIAAGEQVHASEKLLNDAKAHLETIIPSACCNKDYGCEVVMIKRDRVEHERICLFGMPLRNKSSVEITKSDNTDVSIILVAKSNSNSGWEGNYEYVEQYDGYVTINRKEQRLQKLRKIDIKAPKGKAVKWVLSYMTSPTGDDTVAFTSSNEAEKPLDVRFDEYTIEAPETYSWKAGAETSRPSGKSLKILYFGGKWCPYCPPFTAKLSLFFKAVREQKGEDAIDVVFFSSDQNETAMFEYFYQEHGDWLALPYSERGTKEEMSSMYKITGIPGCVVVNSRMEEVEGLELRSMLSSLPSTPGKKLNGEALKVYEKLCKAVRATDEDAFSSQQNINVDIFCSLRFAEAQKEAEDVQKIMKEKYDLNCKIIQPPVGNDIAEEVATTLDAAKLVLIFGTETYGKGTVSFSTKEELQFVMDEKKPFFLLKMCDRFAESRTRLSLPNSVAYFPWPAGTPMPENLPAELMASYEHALLNPTA
mmetsp:Transcript_15281/g.23011  ORF Transcript_15281/g.23011 Transcript_15281/m.23011 type:complete len:1048 (-) Transcript_15281:291-3434(-)